MIRAAAAAIVVLLTAAPAFAEDRPEPRDVAVIVQCLKQADAKGGDEKRCLGLVSGPCLENEKNTVPDMVRCHDREYLAWHNILGRTVQRLHNDMNDEQRVKLKAMQDAWTLSLKRTCRFYEDYGQGSVAGVSEAECAADETGRRVLFLLFFTQDARFLYGSDGK